MDFADDFTYFTFEQVLEEAQKLFRSNRYISDIRLDQSANDGPIISFHLKRKTSLDLKQLGLPVRFRCIPTRLVAANH